jgi:hypothetical protein
LAPFTVALVDVTLVAESVVMYVAGDGVLDLQEYTFTVRLPLLSPYHEAFAIGDAVVESPSNTIRLIGFPVPL